ncbi:MAG: B12-binding domain-containing radical SAM protein [Tannerellaceae bacterium]|jgi:radical SAM superfamily enzyme YgiQ (UPF0313 family)|nr:B12-binding domain-containing radical SAM protein [Tannerellaceae bacterium]
MKDKLVIKLISPRMSLRPMDSELKRRMSPPLSLVTIASMTPKQHRVYIEDENVERLDLNDLPDLVGITVNIDTAYRAFDISKTYRSRGVKVVFGGIYASSCPQEVGAHCDAVCVGEAEEVWGDILEDCLQDRLKPLYQASEPTDLSLVPIADWDFIRQKRKYLYYNVIVTSRGCPFRCEFCYNSCDYVSGKYRNRPVDDIVEEINRTGVKQIMFIDDNFIGNIPWVQRLLDKIGTLGLVWHAAVSTNILHHPQLIRQMAACGCRSLFIGFESLNDGSIRSVNKQQNKISEYEQLIELLHSHGIMVNASLVFGLDEDGPETFDQTLEWLVRNRVETMTGHILTPYPGTVLYKKLQQEGRIICHDLRKYNTSHVVFLPKKLTPEQLRAGYLNMYKKFYSLRNIIRRRPLNKRIIASYFLFNFGYRKYGKWVSLVGRAGVMGAIGKLARLLSFGV